MKELNIKERENYLQTLIFLANSDGVISEEEIGALTIIASNLKVSPSRVAELIDEVKKGKCLADILKGISTRNTKLTLIYELISICYANGEYSNEEKETMKKIVNMLEIEAEKLDEIEQLILEYIDFQKKCNQVLEVSGDE